MWGWIVRIYHKGRIRFNIMSKFNITNINYISSGPKGTVLNLDFEREPIIRKQHILSEETNISAIKHESENKIISISHSNDTKKIID